MSPEAEIAGASGRRARRRDAMIVAARDLFLEKGYDAVTLGDIVRRSGGSLSTFYDLFENKAGVLGAIVEEACLFGNERLDAVVAEDRGPAETLRAIARSIQEELIQPGLIGTMRIAMAESLRNAAFAHAIYERTHLARVRWLAALLGRWTEEGRVAIANPEVAAHFMLGLILHAAQTRALLGGPCDAPGATATECLAAGVDLFIAGYGIADDRATGGL